MTHVAWTMTKATLTLRCDLTRQPIGLELRLSAGDTFVSSQVRCSQDETLALQEAWRAEAKGWRN